MEDKILKEIKQIRLLLGHLTGTQDLPARERFSKEAVAKAAKEFRILSLQRGEWVHSGDIHKVIRNAPWNCSKIIIEKFGFTNYFKRGSSLYFNRKDLLALGKELKDREIDLKRYVELVGDQEKFKKYLAGIVLPKGTKTKKHFTIPESLRDIFSTPYSPPTEQLVRDEIATLMEEYQKFGLSEYIDLYEGKTYGLIKYIYHFDKYIKPETKKFCQNWVFKFNYANEALKRILELKQPD